MATAVPQPLRRSTREPSTFEYNPQGWVNGGYTRIAVRGLREVLSLRWDTSGMMYRPKLRGVRKEEYVGYALCYTGDRLFEILTQQVEPALIRHGLVGPPPSDVHDRIGWEAHFHGLYELLHKPFSQLDRTTAKALRGLPFYAIHVTGVYNLTHHAQLVGDPEERDPTAHALQQEDTGGEEAATLPPTQLEGTPDSEAHGISTPSAEDNKMEEGVQLDRGSCSGWLGRPIKGPGRAADESAHMLGGSKGDTSSKDDQAPPEAGARADDRLVVDLTGEDSDDESLLIYLDD